MITLHEIVSWLYTGPLLLLLVTSWLPVLFWPRSYYPALVAFLVPTWVLSWWLTFRPLPSSDDWGWFGQGIVMLALIATLVAALFRFLGSAILESRRDEPLPSLDWRIAKWSVVGTICGAIFFELGPWVGHALGAPASLSILVVCAGASWTLVVYRKQKGQEHGSWTTVSSILTLGCVLVLIWPLMVVRSAERFAEGHDYCLLVADGERHNRPATNLLELSPVVMRATERRGTAINRHGYIVIDGRSSAHWSYMQGQFIAKNTPTMADDQLMPDTRCIPKTEFARRLPVF